MSDERARSPRTDLGVGRVRGSGHVDMHSRDAQAIGLTPDTALAQQLRGDAGADRHGRGRSCRVRPTAPRAERPRPTRMPARRRGGGRREVAVTIARRFDPSGCARGSYVDANRPGLVRVQSDMGTSSGTRGEPPAGGGQVQVLSQGSWHMSAERSRIGFRVRKMGLYYVKGRFKRVNGSVEVGPDGVPVGGKDQDRRLQREHPDSAARLASPHPRLPRSQAAPGDPRRR